MDEKDSTRGRADETRTDAEVTEESNGSKTEPTEIIWEIDAENSEAIRGEDGAEIDGRNAEAADANGNPAGNGAARWFKKHFTNWSRKKKVTVWSIVAAVLAVVLIVSSVTVKFTMFNDEMYSLDLEAIRNGDPIWRDEFNEFNENVWLKDENRNEKNEIVPRRGGWWLKDAVDVKDGNLRISTYFDQTRKAWVTGAVSATGTPGAEDENGKRGFSRKYGYYETRCKIPAGYGIWSAFWFMPTTAPFNNAASRDASVYGAEIDVFEVPVWPANKVQQAVHVGGYKELHTSTFNPRWLTHDKIDDLYGRYHTYGFYWDENIYKFYIDGNCVWTTSYGNNVAKVEEYMIFSVEIGGTDGQLTENAWKYIGGKLINQNKEGEDYRSEFLIDYVRVWDV